MNIMSKILGILLIAAAIIATCNRGSVINQDDDTSKKITVTEALASGCGGFDAEKTVRSAEETGETLSWHYDTADEKIIFHHAGLVLNCCGVHAVDAWYEDGMVVITENDQPASDGGRCRCMCPFDFKVTLTGMKQMEVEVSILLTIDDDTVEHWAGTIDLGKGGGTILIGTDTSGSTQ